MQGISARCYRINDKALRTVVANVASCGDFETRNWHFW